MITPNDPTSAPPAPVTAFPATDLHVFKLNEDEDHHYFYVAETPTEALRLFDRDTREQDDAEKRVIAWLTIPDDDLLTISNYDEPDSGNDTTLTMREWAAQHGKGLLCTNVDF